MKKRVLGVMSVLLSFQSFSLTCPRHIMFSCSPLHIPKTYWKSRCTLIDVNRNWNFSATDHEIHPNCLTSHGAGQISSSILPPGVYTAKYGFSYYGLIRHRGMASYCLYTINEASEPLFAGLYALDYRKGKGPLAHWRLLADGDGYLCIGAGSCSFEYVGMYPQNYNWTINF